MPQGRSAHGTAAPPLQRPAPDWLLYLGIFLIFGPLGMLLGLIWPVTPGWRGGILMSLYSGTIAVSWSDAFNGSATDDRTLMLVRVR